MYTDSDAAKIEISNQSVINLNKARKWAMFLAIIGFIIFGLITIIGIIALVFLFFFKSDELCLGIKDPLLLIMLIAVSVIYFLPVLFLFRFSKYTRDALQKSDKQKLDKAFKYLRILFAYLGILFIIALSGYIVILVVSGASMSLLRGI